MTNINYTSCPAQCGYQAIKRPTGKLLTSNPPKTEMEWWCACGSRTSAGYELGVDLDGWTRDMWNSVQRGLKFEQEMAEERAKPWWKKFL